MKLFKYLQVHLNKLECRGKVIYFSNSNQIVKLVGSFNCDDFGSHLTKTQQTSTN